MRQIYNGALNIVMRRIKQCGTALQLSQDEHSILYWNKELALAHFKKHLIEKRLKMDHNVIKIDFQSKKRVA